MKYIYKENVTTLVKWVTKKSKLEEWKLANLITELYETLSSSHFSRTFLREERDLGMFNRYVTLLERGGGGGAGEEVVGFVMRINGVWGGVSYTVT